MQRRTVIYIAGEGHNGIKRRLAAWERYYGRSLHDAPLFVSSAPVPFLDANAAAMVAEKVREVAAVHGDPALIIVDTLARNFGDGDENSTKDMNTFVAAVDDLRREFGATALIVHHSGHSDKNRGRGAMSLKGALDAEFKVSTVGDLMTVSATKMKDAALPEPIRRKFLTVELGTGKDGNTLSSAVLIRTDEPALALTPKLGEREQLAIQSFIAAAKKHGHVTNGQSQLLVDINDWRSEYIQQKGPGNADSHRRSFSRALARLIEIGGIVEPVKDKYRLAGEFAAHERELLVGWNWLDDLPDSRTGTGQLPDSVADVRRTGQDTPL